MESSRQAYWVFLVCFAGTWSAGCSSGLPSDRGDAGAHNSSVGGSSNSSTNITGGVHNGGTTNATIGGSSASAGTTTVGGASSTSITSSAGGTTSGSATTGTLSVGGTSPLAGASSMGGANVQGGAPSTGGALATGGTVGSGGSIASGGTTANGGTPITGGTPSLGGTSNAGGATDSGGTTTAGGTSAGNCGVANSGYGGSPDVVFSETFENGIGYWYADNGVWEVGTPGAGPSACYEGTSCAATILNGNYPGGTASRFISQGIALPSLTSGEELHLRFFNWFSYYDAADIGQVQVSVFDTGTSSWGTWQPVGLAVGRSSGGWSLKSVELTPYAQHLIRIGFLHQDGNGPYANGTSTGWYLDALQVVRITPAFGCDFEQGWGDWYADGGVWQVGTPTAGPTSCYQSSTCAGTVLDGNYPSYCTSRLISPTTTLPSIAAGEQLQMRFWQWFSFFGNATGQVQISAWDEQSSTWSDWTNLDQPLSGTSPAWTLKAIDLTQYAAKRVRIALLHSSSASTTGLGWYVDNFSFVHF